MKFSDFSQADWLSMQAYYDTCLLPITGLNGYESPWLMTEALERLRDALDLVEAPFKGRVVVLPAIQYRLPGDEPFADWINEIAVGLKASGFRYVIAVSANPVMRLLRCEKVDLMLVEPQAETVSREIVKLWST